MKDGQDKNTLHLTKSDFLPREAQGDWKHLSSLRVLGLQDNQGGEEPSLGFRRPYWCTGHRLSSGAAHWTVVRDPALLASATMENSQTLEPPRHHQVWGLEAGRHQSQRIMLSSAILAAYPRCLRSLSGPGGLLPLLRLPLSPGLPQVRFPPFGGKVSLFLETTAKQRASIIISTNNTSEMMNRGKTILSHLQGEPPFWMLAGRENKRDRTIQERYPHDHDLHKSGQGDFLWFWFPCVE